MRAESQEANLPFVGAFPTACEHLGGAHVSENVVLHSNAQPITSTLTETVTVPATNSYAQILTSTSDQNKISQADACLFTDLAGKTPNLISIANGMATFDYASQATLPFGPEWQSSLHRHEITLAFSPKSVCANFPFANWGGSTLEVTVATDTANTIVTPQPYLFKHQAYSWRSPPASCAEIPPFSMNVPIGLAEYISTTINQPSGNWLPLDIVLSWSDPLIIALIAFSLALELRRLNNKFRMAFLLIALAGLSLLPAVIDLSSYGYLEDPAELVIIYGITLYVALSLRAITANRFTPRRAVAYLIAASLAGAAMLYGAIRYGSYSRFSGDLNVIGTALTILSAILLVRIGALLFRTAHAIPLGDQAENPSIGWLKITERRDSLVFWVGASLFVALVYSIASVVNFTSFENIIISEFSVLRYPLAAFATLLISVALVAPVAYTGPSADNKAIAMAALGFSLATQQPDLGVFQIQVPVGTIFFAYLVYRLVRRTKPPACDKSSSEAVRLRSCLPYEDTTANAILGAKIAIVLAVVPVGYFAYTVATSLPTNLQQPGAGIIFILASLFGQVVGWALIGVFLGSLSTRLPGRVGPIRALIISAAWFATAFAVQLVSDWYQHTSSRSWIFSGLQLLLFMVAFSIVWDAYVLRRENLRLTFESLKRGYDIQETRSIALYAIPVLVAIIALGQQVASGSAAEFIKSALSSAAAILGGG